MSPAVTILKILFGNFQFLQLSITWNYSNSYVYGIYYISYLEWHASKFMRLSITAVVRVGTFQHYLLPTHVWCCRQTSCNQTTIQPYSQQSTLAISLKIETCDCLLTKLKIFSRSLRSIHPSHKACVSKATEIPVYYTPWMQKNKKKQRLKSAMSSIDCCHTRYE